jgi:hypothetical protein
MATRHGLDGRSVQGSKFGGGQIFCTRTDRPCGPPSLLHNRYRISFPGVKRPRRGVDHPPPSSAEIKERVELYLNSPSGPSWPVLGWILPFYRMHLILFSSSFSCFIKKTSTFSCVYPRAHWSVRVSVCASSASHNFRTKARQELHTITPFVPYQQGWRSRYVLIHGGACSLLAHNVELASCYSSGAYNFQVAPRFLQHLRTACCSTVFWISLVSISTGTPTAMIQVLHSGPSSKCWDGASISQQRSLPKPPPLQYSL